MGHSDIDQAMLISHGLNAPIHISEETKEKAAKVVLGHDSVENAADARSILEHLGLYDFVIKAKS